MQALLDKIRRCTTCQEHLPHGPRPVMAASTESRVIIIGQAPGSKVHASGVPWDDQSGKLLRQWMEIDEADFYDEEKVALIPMGFCYPGKGRSGDLPPRKECAPQWHPALMSGIRRPAMKILIGQYSQRYYLQESAGKNLTETVANFQQYIPEYFPLPHPSPRNRLWLKRNPWFETDLLPVFRARLKEALTI